MAILASYLFIVAGEQGKTGTRHITNFQGADELIDQGLKGVHVTGVKFMSVSALPDLAHYSIEELRCHDLGIVTPLALPGPAMTRTVVLCAPHSKLTGQSTGMHSEFEEVVLVGDQPDLMVLVGDQPDLMVRTSAATL